MSDYARWLVACRHGSWLKLDEEGHHVKADAVSVIRYDRESDYVESGIYSITWASERELHPAVVLVSALPKLERVRSLWEHAKLWAIDHSPCLYCGSGVGKRCYRRDGRPTELHKRRDDIARARHAQIRWESATAHRLAPNLREMHQAGDSIERLARVFNLPPHRVQEAINGGGAK